jgi:hypothetical protein
MGQEQSRQAGLRPSAQPQPRAHQRDVLRPKRSLLVDVRLNLSYRRDGTPLACKPLANAERNQLAYVARLRSMHATHPEPHRR